MFRWAHFTRWQMVPFPLPFRGTEALNGEKPCGVYRFAVRPKPVSFYFCLGQYDTAWGVRRHLRWPAVNTRPLNSAAAADKSEQLPVFFDPHRLRIGGVLFLRCRFGHAARAQG